MLSFCVIHSAPNHENVWKYRSTILNFGTEGGVVSFTVLPFCPRRGNCSVYLLYGLGWESEPVCRYVSPYKESNLDSSVVQPSPYIAWILFHKFAYMNCDAS